MPLDMAGCKKRKSGYLQLSYNGQLVIDDLDCPASGSALIAAAGDIAKSFLSIICGSIPGLSCSNSDKIVITKFCGRDVNVDIGYSSSSGRRFLSGSGNDVVEFTLILNAVAKDDLRQKDSLLNQYLQGSTMDAILGDVLAEVVATSGVAELQVITAIYYSFVNSYIRGLGLYYPAWGDAETCLNDGQQKEYMNDNAESWLYPDLESCCKRYYSWDEVGCLRTNAEATLVSSSGSALAFPDPTADLYYPAWGTTESCVNDGAAPAYMTKQPDTWMHATLAACCKDMLTVLHLKGATLPLNHRSKSLGMWTGNPSLASKVVLVSVLAEECTRNGTFSIRPKQSAVLSIFGGRLVVRPAM
eukprot:scaffold1576_cov192-Alexandrium_tamarense.AAC.7